MWSFNILPGAAYDPNVERATELVRGRPKSEETAVASGKPNSWEQFLTPMIV